MAMAITVQSRLSRSTHIQIYVGIYIDFCSQFIGLVTLLQFYQRLQ